VANTTQTLYPGFDSFWYPGDVTMKSIYDNTGLWWCGFYLGMRFNWHSHFGTIKSMGWGVAPIYTGKQPGSSAKLKAIRAANARHPDAMEKALWDDGALDGKEAAEQARASGIPPNTILYFDVEQTIHDPDWLVYYRGWSRGVVDRYFNVGLYTRPDHASWVNHRLLSANSSRPFDICMPEVWVAKYTRANGNGAAIPPKDFLQDPFPMPDPAAAYPDASVLQHLGNFGMKWSDSGRQRKFSPVDYNSSIYPDPGLGFLSLFGS